MEIQINQKHKSITPPCNFDLPLFSVLTGKNGSGKTHLLEAIADTKISIVTLNGVVLKNIRYIGFNGLNPNISETCDPQTITKHIKSSWNTYSQKLQSMKQSEPQNNNPLRLLDYIGNNIKEANLRRHYSKIIESSTKDFRNLTEDDFADYFDISFMGQNDFFTAQFALLFKNYHKRQEENNINEYYASKGQQITKPVLSEIEFEKKYGIPPWDFVNEILLETNIPYEVNSPVGTRLDSNFVFKLKDRTQGFEISSMDLSTGEKVLMSLALAIYNTGGDMGKPDLLLLDEPDAGLHPSMSKKMVDVLNKNIVIGNNIPTIISTHSPTTIIASEGISIYQMIRGNNSPTKIATQEAVEILSFGVPFLKISNDRRRQVFVESKYDVNYYELLTNIFSRFETLHCEPIFLPARTSNGSNCTDVIEIVNSLTSNGNDQVYGIIDWDTTNRSQNKVLVLGEDDRYSIENYLLDPLLMGILLIRERKFEFSYFGITSLNKYSELDKLNTNDAQLIIDKILSDVGLFSENFKQTQIINGWTLNVTNEFVLLQGHSLENLYKTTYPFLNAYHRENQLKIEVIEKVINDYPTLASNNLLEIIRKIK
ncbi:MAG: ATP-binding protein [Bacteroidota bacterium]